ncbi:MAG: flagellar basal body L-ring protein FlgH [Planctomycetes bacterium]|nr:flagellar basal body L-ring protein FlgH [Planctomycetota bacterium]
MQNQRNRLSSCQRELLRRCLVIMLASIFFFLLAAIRARGGEAYNRTNDPWAFPDEDDYDVMSDDDHIMASRLRRQIVGARPVYHRRKASRIHDSVTIVVKEDTSSEMKTSGDLKRDSSNSMTLTNWLTPTLAGGLGWNQKGEAAGGNTPTIAYSNNRNHRTDSTIDRGQTFTTTLTGKVIEVHPNGYLVIEARKSVNVNGEIQTVTLTGAVNPDHLDSNSQVQADFIMDMAIDYNGSGPMTRMNRRGWASKLIDFLNPF